MLRVVLLAVLVLAPLAGQSAQPTPIVFPRGTYGTTVRGSIRDAQQREYSLNAAKGQTLTLRLRSSPSGVLGIRILDENGSEIPLQQTEDGRLQTKLSQTGEVTLLISRKDGGRGRVTFTLGVRSR